jgi:hypothetical protein
MCSGLSSVLHTTYVHRIIQAAYVPVFLRWKTLFQIGPLGPKCDPRGQLCPLWIYFIPRGEDSLFTHHFFLTLVSVHPMGVIKGVNVPTRY